jgi:LmbE family N-acetylglucosaminyl deacetylase
MTIDLRPQRVLALAPHPDDIELGMGGTIAMLIERGCDVHIEVFSLAEASLPLGYSKCDIQNECVCSLVSLGVSEQNIQFHDFPVRRFDENRQDILEGLIRSGQNLNPDIIFCPSLSDTHQDHSVVANESVRAFRKKTVLGYELPWNTKNFDSSLTVSLTEQHIDAKESALTKYKSQLGRPYFEPGLLKNHSRIRATVAGLEYAESFEMIRMVFK